MTARRPALGISSWSLPWAIGVEGYPAPRSPLGPLDLLDVALRHGVEVVQIADNAPLESFGPSELADLRRHAERSSITLEVGTRGLDVEHVLRYVGIASELGAPRLRTVISGSHRGRAELLAVQQSLAAIVPELERHGVVLALENNEAFSAAEFAELASAAASPQVGICLDTANSLGRAEPLDVVVDRLAAHTVMLHLKDYEIERIDTRMGFHVVGRAVGEGRVDVRAVLTQVALSGRPCASVIVEHWPPFLDDIDSTVTREREWLARSVAFLAAAIDEVWAR